MTEGTANDDSDLQPLTGLRPLPTRSAPPLFRDTIESFTLAIIIALVVKSFLAEAYKVPTGSMEPTIHGAKNDGDRILVNKLAALLREPRRWETWVFQYPNNRSVNYVKRVVGIGPESLRLVAGDVYTSPAQTNEQTTIDLWRSNDLQVARKPDSIRNAVFERYPQVSESAVNFVDEDEFHNYWLTPKAELDDQTTMRFESGLLMECQSRTWAHFRNAIKDRLDLEAPISPTNQEGVHDVGDLRIDIEVVPESDQGLLLLQIRDCELSEFIDLRLAIGADNDGAGLFLGDKLLQDFSHAPLERGHSYVVSLANADDRITVQIDGEEVAREDYRHEPLAAAGVLRWPARVSFGLESARIRFKSAQVYRDIYYRGGGSRGRSIFDPAYESWSVDIPKDHYYVLGDNSPASNDSREWRRTEITWAKNAHKPIYGDLLAITDPDNLEERQDNPFTIEEDGQIKRIFVDEFGNKHEIDSYGIVESSRTLPSPLVPRSLLVGRAFAIFLPLSRLRLVR